MSLPGSGAQRSCCFWALGASGSSGAVGGLTASSVFCNRFCALNAPGSGGLGMKKRACDISASVRGGCLHLEFAGTSFRPSSGICGRSSPSLQSSSPKISVAGGTSGLGYLWGWVFLPCEDFGSSTSWEQRMRSGRGDDATAGGWSCVGTNWGTISRGLSSSAGEPGPCSCSCQGWRAFSVQRFPFPKSPVPRRTERGQAPALLQGTAGIPAQGHSRGWGIPGAHPGASQREISALAGFGAQDSGSGPAGRGRNLLLLLADVARGPGCPHACDVCWGHPVIPGKSGTSADSSPF